MVRRKTTTLLIFLLLAATATAQDGYKGKEFWLVFPRNARAGENPSALKQLVQFVGEPGTTGSIKNAKLEKVYQFTIDSSRALTLALDTTEVFVPGKHINTWHITSAQDITVIATSHRKASTDSYVVLPISLLGTEYAAIGYYPMDHEPVFTTQFDIIATEENTIVRIEYPKTTPLRSHIDTINKGEALHYTSNYMKDSRVMTGDITGTIVTANKPIAFITGHSCAQVPSHVNFCDFLVEMLPHTGDLGTDHVVPKLIDQEHSSIRVVAVSDETEVTVNGERRSMLRRGEFYQSDSIAGSARVSTSKPAYVMQYGQSAEVSEDKVADPFMMLVAPVHKGMSTLEFSVPQFAKEPFSTWEHFINVVTTREGVDALRAEPEIPFKKYFKQLGNSEFYVAAIPITHTKYALHSTAPFFVYQYGYNDTYDSYGHLCGMKAQPYHHCRWH